MDNERIENYAKSLLKHGWYSTIEEALVESIRWHKKKERGFEEPLKCPHRPEIMNKRTYTKNGGMVIEYFYMEKSILNNLN